MLHKFPRSIVIGIAMIAAGVVVFVVGALGAPRPELLEWVFTLWFLAFMILITWGAALILRPFVQSVLGNILDRR
jgi:uncharacterized membrane protein YiaA